MILLSTEYHFSQLAESYSLYFIFISKGDTWSFFFPFFFFFNGILPLMQSAEGMIILPFTLFFFHSNFTDTPKNWTAIIFLSEEIILKLYSIT